jgi:DNA-binding transcriptional MerR regulator
MRIGELAKRSGLTVETLRFYERAGVLGAVTRDPSGYRVYDEQAFRTLVMVRLAQDAGLRLEDIATILDGTQSAPPKVRVAILQRLVDERLEVLRGQIERLEQTIERLMALRSVPFDGECVIPAAFVDELVQAHTTERQRDPAASAGDRRPKKRRQG